MISHKNKQASRRPINVMPPEPKITPITQADPFVTRVNQCRVAECTRPQHLAYLCRSHYIRWRDCQRPNLNNWLHAGAPGPVRWSKLISPPSPPVLSPTIRLSPAASVYRAINIAGRRPPYDRVVRVVCYRLHLDAADLATSRRHKHLVLARELVVYLAHEWCSMSYPEIARAMGRTSHSTLVEAHQRLRSSIASDREIMLMDGPVRAAPLLIQLITELSVTTPPPPRQGNPDVPLPKNQVALQARPDPATPADRPDARR